MCARTHTEQKLHPANLNYFSSSYLFIAYPKLASHVLGMWEFQGEIKYIPRILSSSQRATGLFRRATVQVIVFSQQYSEWRRKPICIGTPCMPQIKDSIGTQIRVIPVSIAFDKTLSVAKVQI